MKYLLHFVCMLFFVSCTYKKQTSSSQIEVFLGFKLGSSISQVDQKASELLRRGQLTNLENHYYYYTFPFGLLKYHCVPLFYTGSGDSVIQEIKLLYFDNTEYALSDISATKSGKIALNLKTYDNTFERVCSQPVKESVIDELNWKYGAYVSRDTVKNVSFNEFVKWSPNDSLDIFLEYVVDPTFNPSSKFINGNSSLVVTYSYSGEVKSKLFKKKSAY